MKGLFLIGCLALAIASDSQVLLNNHYADSIAVKYSETITAEELKQHLNILASDKFEGRETGMPGQKAAAEYIVNYFNSLGVPPCVDGSYLQEFPLRTEKTVDATMAVDEKAHAFFDDFYFFPGFNQTNLKGNLTFAGYGIESAYYNDYANLNAKNKILVVLDGEPFDKSGASLVTGVQGASEWSGDWRLKRDVAMKNGATALIILNRDYDQYTGRIKYWLTNPGMKLDMAREERQEVLPTYFVRPEVFDAMVGGAKKRQAFIKKISKSRNPISKPLKSRVDININREVNTFTSENILCYIEGSDPLLKHELVVITAHYDHVGVINGEIHNGADDDGSGTVAAMEIAEAFMAAKKDGFGPRRSVLVMLVSGEEKGLLGSEWYTEFPVFPLESTVVDLNIDMIGRKDAEHADSNYVYLIGSDKLSTTLHQLSEKVNESFVGLTLDYTYNDPKDPNRYYYRSDHYNFAKNNIPCIFYFSGVHEDYHKPTDDTDKIMYEKTATIAQLVFLTGWEVANREKRLVVDVENDFR
ncbi:MAG: hypothetical protein RL226_2156 [Bacteroidota bacterium]